MITGNFLGWDLFLLHNLLQIKTIFGAGGLEASVGWASCEQKSLESFFCTSHPESNLLEQGFDPY